MLVIGASLLVLGWTVLPLVTVGSDETLDPGRLVLLPLKRGPTMRGLLLASLVGFAPAGVMLALTGVIAGYGRGAGRVLVVFAVGVTLFLSAATARMVSTVLASRLTSRRGRDAMVVVASLLALALQALRFVRLDFVHIDAIDRVASVARWLPPGMLGQAVFDADRGRLLAAAVEVMVPLVALPVVLVVWARALDRQLTVVTGDSGTASVDPDGSPLPLLARWLRFIPATPWGAVTAKELRYIAREPRRKVLLLNSLILGAGIPLYVALTTRGSLPHHVVLTASFVGYVAVLNSMNQLGYDGAALWVDVVAGQVVRAELIGKNVAMLVMVTPAMLAATVILAAVSGGWLYLPAALALGLTGVGIGLAVANVTSVRFPQALPETRSPFGRGGAGAGCATAVSMFAAMFVQAILIAPVGAAAAVAAYVQPALLLAVIPAAAGYAYLLWRGGLRSAERFAWWRQPELIAAVHPKRA